MVQEMDDDHYAVRFIPHENGVHWVHVRFNGVDIPESPIRVCVGTVNADPGRVFASGEGLHTGETGGKPCEFVIDTLKAGAGALAVTVDGPAKVQLNCKEVPEGYKVSFVPSVPGDYLITVKFVGTNIAGSPFKCRVTGAGGGAAPSGPSSREHSNIVFETVEKTLSGAHLLSIQKSMQSDATKVKVLGTGIQKAFRNQKAKFVVETKEAGEFNSFFFYSLELAQFKM
jgi:filamin